MKNKLNETCRVSRQLFYGGLEHNLQGHSNVDTPFNNSCQANIFVVRTRCRISIKLQTK